MARRKVEAAPENTERWLTTYADLISLLMIFFVVMFASSEISKDKLLSISESLRRALTNESATANSVGVAILSDPSRSTITAASVSTDERGTIISIVDSLFFGEGEIGLNDRVKPLLREVAQFSKDTDARVVIEGHTDDRRVSGDGLIRSNWELSALRATEVVRFFIDEVGFNPTKISAAAYGSTKPLVNNIGDTNRARNRRIDIILLNAEVRTRRTESKELTQLELIERTRKAKESDIDKILNPYATPEE